MTIDQDIISLEQRFWQSMIDKDPRTGASLVSDPCLVTGAQGVGRIDREGFAKMMQEGEWKLHAFDLTDVKAESVMDDVAIIAYKVREKLTVEGKNLILEAADASTWVRGEDGWKCALHTESVLGDPFGRDRRVVKPDAESSPRKN